MDNLFIKKEDGSYIMTPLNKQLNRKAGETIELLFDVLLDSGITNVEAKYVIDMVTEEVMLNKILNLHPILRSI